MLILPYLKKAVESDPEVKVAKDLLERLETEKKQ